MRRGFFLTVFIAMTMLYTVTIFAEDVFVYDAHKRHDPFNPLVTPTGSVQLYDSDLTVSDLTLEGILEDPAGNSAAIINGKILKVGDQIGAYQIQSIANDHVILLKDGEGFTLNIKKGG